MKPVFFLFALFMSLAAGAQNKDLQKVAVDTTQKPQVVEAACGQCLFGLKGKGCDLAVRIDGKAYFVDGTHIDEHGDAHAEDGFCNAVRKAEVKGNVVADRFVASYFKLVSTEEKKKKKK